MTKVIKMKDMYDYAIQIGFLIPPFHDMVDSQRIMFLKNLVSKSVKIIEGYKEPVIHIPKGYILTAKKEKDIMGLYYWLKDTSTETKDKEK